jgi:hypothetical protein
VNCGIPEVDVKEMAAEALGLYRTLINFKNYAPEGGADKAIVYLNVFISMVLRDIGKGKNS